MRQDIRVLEPEYLDEGDGAKAYRLLPNEGEHLDPFVLFDEYLITPDASFPMHPHGGFEGFQFLMEGSTEYSDNRGNTGLIRAGWARRFVPADGFMHSETPRHDGTTRGYLLWIKLPGDIEPDAPLFKETDPSGIPLTDDGRILMKRVLGEGSALETFTPVVMEVLKTREDAVYEITVEGDHNGFIYVSQGKASVGGLEVYGKKGAVLSPGTSSQLQLEAGTEMVFVKGKRLGEEIVQEGHFVKS